MPLLETEHLEAGYASVPVVRDLSVHVDEGEIVALVGPNGSGKTTTLLTISGLLPPLGGRLSVLGDPVRSSRPHLGPRRGVAHVPEDRSLFFELTVSENLRLGERGNRHGSQYALELFPALVPLLKKEAGLLSGGEQQMLSLGRALASRPKLLMVDEMSLGLAPVIVEGIFPVLRNIAAESDCGVLIVEQHVVLALEVADRAYVLSHGELHYDGTAAHLREHPELLRRSYFGDDADSDAAARDGVR